MPEALGFDQFIGELDAVFSQLPDVRKPSPNLRYAVRDAALGAFAMFFSQSPSFLSYQQGLEQREGRNNARSLFGVSQIPSDHQIRNLLDVVAPSCLAPVFWNTFQTLEQRGHLATYRRLEGHLLVPLEGRSIFVRLKFIVNNVA